MDDTKNRSQPRESGGHKSQPHKNRHSGGSRPGDRPHHQHRITATTCAEALHAPYNFVPLSNWVHIPDWSAAVSHDLPFEDGLCGELTIEISAETPVLIGSEKAAGSNAVHPYRLPDGRYAIPGATLKGMLRNMLEIATFGRMSAVDDQQFALRDLSGPIKNDYQKKFATTVRKADKDGRMQMAYAALPETGWLKYKDGKWQVAPCAHARVDHDVLDNLLRAKGADPGTPGPFRQIAKSGSGDDGQGKDDRNPKLPILKYRRFVECIGEKLSKEPTWKWLQVRYEMEGKAFAQEHSEIRPGQRKYLFYQRVTRVGNGAHTGHIVFTGQPGPKKHMEFMFYDAGEPREPLQVPDKVTAAFLALHNPAKESKNGRRPPAAVVWDFHQRERPYGERGTPVFFLRDAKGQIESLGLAQMYRLPYTLTIGQAIGNTQEHPRRGEADFCETLFGHIAEDKDKGLRGRVAFGHAAACGPVKPQALGSTILNGPKASYFPNYMLQNEATSQGDRLRDKGQYTTLMNEKARIRGWKRYPVRDGYALQVLTPEQKKNQDIQTQLNPLPAGTVFESRIRFHNLLPEELGALVWALNWGGASHCRHAIGMGKPFGMGRVKLAIKASDIRPNREGRATLTPEECRTRFVEHMESAHAEAVNKQEWRTSPQLKALLAMANPAIGNTQTLQHMRLGEGRDANEFVNAKKAGLVLPEYPTGAEKA